MTARINCGENDEGVIYATGNENSGLTVFVQNSRLVVDYNAFNDHSIVESEITVPPGESVLCVKVARTSSTTGRIDLAVNETVCGDDRIAIHDEND